MKTIKIPISVEYMEHNEYTHAVIYSEGDYFVVEASSYTKLKDKSGYQQEQYDVGYRIGIPFKELIEWLPNIGDAIKEQINIEVITEALPKRYKTGCEANLYCTTYKVKVGNSTVLKKNTYKDGSIQEIRGEIVSYIARLVYNYQLFTT